MADAVLSDEVKDVLARSSVNGNVVVLPPGQLVRGLYAAVNKALQNAGGKWKTRVGHVFPTDPAPKLAAMLGTGVSVDEKKRDQAFFTPDVLADRVAELADVRGCDVLDPEAGRGSLLRACLRAGAARAYAVEMNKEYAQQIDCTTAIYSGYDFLELTELWGGRLFNRIVMNPPFTKNQDIAHVRHALRFLAPHGILVAIILNNQTRKGFVDLNVEYEPEIDEIERGAFKESGTDVPTVIVKIQL